MRRSLAAFGIMVAALASGNVVQASQLPDDDPAPWVLTYPSDLEITYAEDGTTGMTLAEMVQVNYDPNWPGMGPNNYWTNSFTGDPYSRDGVNVSTQLSWYSQTWGGDLYFNAATLPKAPCPVTATRGVEMRCERNDVTFAFSRPVTDPVIHFNNLGANSYALNDEWLDQRLWMHGDSILTLDLANSAYIGTPALVLESAIGNIAVVNDGADYHLPAGSPLNGAPAITRTADPSVDTTNRPDGHYVEGSFGAGSVRVEGTWTELVFNRDLLWSFNTFSATTTPWRDPNNFRQGRNECILDQVPLATIYRCDDSGTTWTPNTAEDITTNVYQALQVLNPFPEGTSFVITVDEDFGTGPATYDGTDGASHVVGDAAIGSAASSSGDELTASNGGASGIVSPNADGADDDDDAFASGPMLPESGDYTVAIPLSGISQPAKLCGWIDADASGTFDPTERACADVDPNDTSATLTWPSSTTSSITTSTWMRLRLSYDTTGVESPTGRVDSGEVEDWELSPYSPPPPTTAPGTTAPTSTDAPTTPTTEAAAPDTTIPAGTDAPQPTATALPATGGSGTLLPVGTALLGAGLVLVARRRIAVR